MPLAGSLLRILVRSWIIAAFVIASLVMPANAVDLRYVLTHAAEYAPPPCPRDPCVLTGPGGIVQGWFAHVDKYQAMGRSFVVKGVCASACEMAARRVNARLLPGARLIYHKPTRY